MQVGRREGAHFGFPSLVISFMEMGEGRLRTS